MDFDEQLGDAERIRINEARLAARDLDWITAAVRHRPTGQLAAFTDLIWPRSRPAGIWQEDTLVRADHRGHRLGMLIKTAYLLALVEANPGARRVHTWNAAENGYMLSINTALGFRLVGLEGAWQKRA